MKRSHYQIEGDLLSSRSISLEKENQNLPLKYQTLFTSLPIEILGFIVNYVTPNAYDLQQFLRFLLIEFGISLVKHASIYSNVQSQLLDILKERLGVIQPLIFEKCKKIRLNNIEYCANQSNFIYKNVSVDQHFQSIQTILNAKYADLYTFINYALCECCRKNFSNSDENIAICDRCDQWYSEQYKFKDDIIDCKLFLTLPQLQYQWITEAKLKKWCCIPQNEAIKSFFILIRNRKDTRYRLYYLLKDALPYIDAKFIINKSCL